MSIPVPFDAFLSYSSRDAPRVARLARLLEAYVAPRSLKAQRRRLKLFSYETDQRPSPSLLGELTRRVRSIPALILAASPSSARAEYVNREVSDFLQDSGAEGRRQHSLFVVVVAGAVPPLLPPVLVERGFDPAYIDARDLGSGLLPWIFWRKRRTRRSLLPLVAALLDLEVDVLVRRDRVRFRRRLAAISTIGVATLATAGYFLDEAWTDSRTSTLFAEATSEQGSDSSTERALSPCDRNCSALKELSRDLRAQQRLPGLILATHDSRLRFLRNEEAFRTILGSKRRSESPLRGLERACTVPADSEHAEVCGRLALALSDSELAGFVVAAMSRSEPFAKSVLEQLTIGRLEALRIADRSLESAIQSVVRSRLEMAIQYLSANSNADSLLDDLSAIRRIDPELAEACATATVVEVGDSVFHTLEDRTASRLLQTLSPFLIDSSRLSLLARLETIALGKAGEAIDGTLLPAVAALTALPDDLRMTRPELFVSRLAASLGAGGTAFSPGLAGDPQMAAVARQLVAVGLLQAEADPEDRNLLGAYALSVGALAGVNEETIRDEVKERIDGRPSLLRALAAFPGSAEVARTAAGSALSRSAARGVYETVQVSHWIKDAILAFGPATREMLLRDVLILARSSPGEFRVAMAPILATCAEDGMHCDGLADLKDDLVRQSTRSPGSEKDRFLAMHTLAALGDAVPPTIADRVAPLVGHWMVPYLDRHELYYTGGWIDETLGVFPSRLSTDAARAALERLMVEGLALDKPSCELMSGFVRLDSIDLALDLLTWPTCSKSGRSQLLRRLGKLTRLPDFPLAFDSLATGWSFQDGTAAGGHIDYGGAVTFEGAMEFYLDQAEAAAAARRE